MKRWQSECILQSENIEEVMNRSHKFDILLMKEGMF